MKHITDKEPCLREFTDSVALAMCAKVDGGEGVRRRRAVKRGARQVAWKRSLAGGWSSSSLSLSLSLSLSAMEEQVAGFHSSSWRPSSAQRASSRLQCSPWKRAVPSAARNCGILRANPAIAAYCGQIPQLRHIAGESRNCGILRRIPPLRDIAANPAIAVYCGRNPAIAGYIARVQPV